MYANITYYCCLHIVPTYYYRNKYYSHNVLIDDDGRALLTDFGLSKTEGTISTSSTTKSLFHGGTLAWTAPELFNAVRGQTCTQLFTAKSDVYSYGK
jgi:serine/threonine protein kinase